MPKLPLRADEEESRAVTNHLCGMLENPRTSQLVLGSSFETLPQVLSILIQVATSDPTEELCNKALKGRISNLVRSIAQSIPPQAFQGAVTQLPQELQRLLQTL